MNGSRPLVFVAQMVVASCVVGGLANCGGAGERPRASEDPSFDGGGSITTPDAAAAAVSILGYDPAAGLIFGDNGLVNCGGQAPNKDIVFKNNTNDIVNFKAKLTSGVDLYQLTPAEGGVPARGETTLQIVPKPLPQESDVTPDLYAGTLEIQFATGEPPTVIRLHQTARGAIVSTTLAAGTFDFGDVKVATEGKHQFSMTNAGNVDVTATVGLGGQDFKIDSAQTAVIPLKSAQTAAKTLSLTPTVQTAYNDILTVSYNSSAVHCKPPPTNTNLKGKGATSVLVAPGTVNFGLVNCATAALPQTITITSTAAMGVTPNLGKLAGSPFTLAKAGSTPTPLTPGAEFQMGASETYVMQIVPKTIVVPTLTTPNLFDDVLTITTTAAGDQPHTVALRQTAKGAYLEVSKETISVTDNLPNHDKTDGFILKNSGNGTVGFNLQIVAQDPDFQHLFNLNPSTGVLGGLSQTNVAVTITSPPAGQQKAKIVLTPRENPNDPGSGVVVCGGVVGDVIGVTAEKTN